MEKIQQEFEAWANTTSLKNFLFWHPSDNQYEVHAVQMAFEGWKASRAAVFVDLPIGLTEGQFTKLAEQIEGFGGDWQ
ncbi:MAG: hypothetical protein ACRDC4_00430 [Plesiomonas sp.]